MKPRRRRAFALWLGSAIVLVAAAAAFAFVLAATDLSGTAARPSGSGAAGASPASSPWLISIAPGQLGMPEGADCNACHLTSDGVVGVKAIPAIAHPVHGWSNCTECHSNDRLVQTAPGHTGIHADQCLVCHRESSQPAPKPLHPTLPNSDCLACHGTIAPLPASMTDKPRQLCWLCHHN
jgi:hypothetical protein